MNALRIALCLLLLIATVPLMAQGTYTQIDVPGAVYTFAYGINGAGDVVGEYADAALNVHGFLLSGGVYTSIDYPGAVSTCASGINDVGQIVGSTPQSGFTYDVSTQVFAPINFPDAQYLTHPLAINNSGTVVGYVYASGQSHYIGFELLNGTYRALVPTTLGRTNTFARGINNSGVIVVLADTIDGTVVNFLFQQGQFKRVLGSNKMEEGINDSDAIVGWHTGTGGIVEGFVYQGNSFQTLVYPGAGYTSAQGINKGGEVVGFFNDANWTAHGFIWTPSADAPKP